MGTGWRRAFCTRDRAVVDKDRESPKKCVKLGFLSGVGGSTSTTPRMQKLSLDDCPNSLRCKTNITNQNVGYNNNNNIDSPTLHCKTTMKCSSKSTPASPRSPFAILKNSFRLHKNNCGVCLESVKTGQGKAIFTAECAHSFHFPCISAHVRKLGALVCPLCKSTWKHVPLLAFHNSQPKHSLNLNNNNNNNNNDNNQPKPYSDDEPLKSPRGGLGFVPIPEADDEGEEFQGFFVDPVRSNTDGGYLRNITFEILPEVALVSVGRSHETYALVLKIKAPSAPPAEEYQLAAQKQQARAVQAQRAPVDLVTVLDVSDSMTGAKLEMMKRAVRLVVSSLGPSDRLSILSFSADPPARLLPLRRMTPQGHQSARRIVDRLFTSRSGGRGQSLAQALASASKVLEDRRERNPVATIMLLSDGHDEKVHVSGSNHHRRRGSASASTRFAHMEIPVGSGDGFAKCVSGFLSVVAQDLTVEIGFSPGEISAVYSCNGRPTVFDTRSVRIGDLYAEEEREFLVEVRVPTPLIGSHHVLSVRSNYRQPSDGKTINGQDRLLVPRPTRSPIGRLRSLFVATRASAEARRLIENDEVASAHQLLASSRALLISSGSGSGDEFVKGLEAELAEIQRTRENHMKTIQRRREGVMMTDENGEPLTPTSAWRAAEQLAKVAQIKKSMNRVGDLHGFENARF